jgi:20S proteasome subunit beta 5
MASTAERRLFDFKKGTTTLGFVYRGGIVVAVDSRASMGALASSKIVMKIIKITDSHIATLAGTAADCQFWLSWLTMQARVYELQKGAPATATALSKICVNLINYYKSYGMSMGLTLAGYDGSRPRLFVIDTEGNRFESHIVSCGSGSPYAYSLVDSFYRYDMAEDQAVELGLKAIYHATHRDSGSSGFARCVLVTPAGTVWKEQGKSVDQMHWEVKAEKGLPDDPRTFV